jgi:cytochrome c-type biogenesis protein CcmH/NrfF
VSKPGCFLLVGLCLSLNLLMPAPQEKDVGKEAEQKSCTLCHSLRLVQSQRLTAAAWQKEVDKMIGWGAVVPDRQVLIDYLTRNYGNTLPQPAPVLSGSAK